MWVFYFSDIIYLVITKSKKKKNKKLLQNQNQSDNKNENGMGGSDGELLLSFCSDRCFLLKIRVVILVTNLTISVIK